MSGLEKETLTVGRNHMAGESREKNTIDAIVTQPCAADKRKAKQAAFQARADEALATAEAKRFATLAACATLAGQSLRRTSTGCYILSRWTYSKHCTDLSAVESLLGRIECAPTVLADPATVHRL